MKNKFITEWQTKQKHQKSHCGIYNVSSSNYIFFLFRVWSHQTKAFCITVCSSFLCICLSLSASDHEPTLCQVESFMKRIPTDFRKMTYNEILFTLVQMVKLDNCIIHLRTIPVIVNGLRCHKEILALCPWIFTLLVVLMCEFHIIHVFWMKC